MPWASNTFLFGLLILLPSVVWSLGLGTFRFSSNKDKTKCESLKFQPVSTYRRVSTEEMTRNSAHECCRMRGMTLYSVEKVDEPKNFVKQFSDKIGADAESKWFWVSANNIKEKSKFRWEFGGLVDENSARSKKWDPHVWLKDQPDSKGRCVVANSDKDKIVMKVADCEKSVHPFICELEPQGRGKDLSVLELSTCSQSNTSDLSGFPSLKIFEQTGRWPMANWCCQQRGWALIDDIAGKGKRFHDVVSNHEWGLPMSGQQSSTIWSSGNDLQEYGKWQWACGDDVVTDLKWLSPNPDNKEGDEHCIMYKDVDVKKGFQADDVNCNGNGVVICDTNPRCNTDEQYPRGAKDPRTYDVYDTIEEDSKECDSIQFVETKGNQTDNSDYPYTFFIGDKKISWAAATTCCQKRNMTSVILMGPPDVSRVHDIMKEISYGSGKKFLPKPIWTGSTNWLDSMRSRLKWPNGEYVKTYISDPTIIHDDIYPICGLYSYISPRGFYLISANCLEKNLVVCMKRNESYSISGLDSMSETEVPAQDDAHDALYNKSLAVLTTQEQEYKVVVISRDRCSKKGILDEYHTACPKSSSDISPYKKLSTSKNITDEDKFKINIQNKRLLTTVINSGIFGYEVPSHAPVAGFKLLSMSMDIYTKVCPIVPTEFIQMAFKLFHDIHWATSQGRSDIIRQADYKWIVKLLNKCANFVKPVHVRTDKCGDEFIAVDNCTNFVCTSPLFEFKLYRTDPLVDMMWKVYEMIHSICFPYFEESYRMYHKYAQSIMDLWSYEIKLRWFNQLADNEFWSRVLGPGYDIHLVNMERCNQASIMRTFFHIRLARHTIPDRTRLIGGRNFLYAT